MTVTHSPNLRRRERTRRELEALRSELSAWLTRWRAWDRAQQYTRQLESLEACLQGAAQALAERLASLHLQLPAGEFAEQCRRHELRLLWLRRLWRFFRERLEQREDTRLGPLLRAADEVVWSAWRPPFERAPAFGLVLQPGPVPLPFVDLEYSPAATPPSWIPPELRRDGGPLLAQYLERLPVALVHVPVACLTSPWWLVFAGHEVGHQVQEALGLLLPFRSHLAQAVERRAAELRLGDPALCAERWGRWSQEVFADVYSVVACGSAAVRALAEFELAPDTHMTQPRERYPAAAVRLELVAALAEALGLPRARESLVGLEPRGLVQGHLEAEEDLALVGAAVAAAREALPGLGVSLEDLLHFNPAHFQLAALEVPEPFDLSGPRRMVAAAVAEWSAAEAEGASDEALSGLAERLVREAGENRLPGLRSEQDAVPLPPGEELAEALLGMDVGHLEAARRGAA